MVGRQSDQGYGKEVGIVRRHHRGYYRRHDIIIILLLEGLSPRHETSTKKPYNSIPKPQEPLEAATLTHLTRKVPKKPKPPPLNRIEKILGTKIEKFRWVDRKCSSAIVSNNRDVPKYYAFT